MTKESAVNESFVGGDASRHGPLAMDAATFRKLGHRLVDQLAGFLESLPSGPVTRDEPPSVVREALDLTGPLPEMGTDPGPLLEETAQLLFAHSLFNGHPRFGDFLAAALNPNVGAWTLSPAATEIECQTVRWIAELIGYPINCGGLLVSGGNMANFVCFLAARTAKRTGIYASMAFLKIQGANFACTVRAKRTHGFKRPQTLAASVPIRYGGSPPIPNHGWTSRLYAVSCM